MEIDRELRITFTDVDSSEFAKYQRQYLEAREKLEILGITVFFVHALKNLEYEVPGPFVRYEGKSSVRGYGYEQGLSVINSLLEQRVA